VDADLVYLPTTYYLLKSDKKHNTNVMFSILPTQETNNNCSGLEGILFIEALHYLFCNTLQLHLFYKSNYVFLLGTQLHL